MARTRTVTVKRGAPVVKWTPAFAMLYGLGWCCWMLLYGPYWLFMVLRGKHRARRFERQEREAEAALARWETDEQEKKGKPRLKRGEGKVHRVGGETHVGTIVNIEDLPTKEREWEPFPETA